jgi:predicted GNAT family N-acyltransferase
VKLDAWPDEVARKLPRYPSTPATLLGRLAVDIAYRGQRLGERLLVDALGRSLEASRRAASVAVIVEAKDAAGAEFYRRYGFKPFPEQPLRLFITMRTVAGLVA